MEKGQLKFEDAFCAALTGFLSRDKDPGWCVQQAHRVATMSVAMVNDGIAARTQKEEEDAAKRALEDGNGKTSGQTGKGTYQRPAGA